MNLEQSIAAFPSLPSGTRTNCGMPWALIKRGGQTPGKRPGTRLAFITTLSSPNGGRTLTIKAIMPNSRFASATWTKPRPVDERDIVKQWRNAPSKAAVAKAKKGLSACRLQP